jgi:hypothetical protein
VTDNTTSRTWNYAASSVSRVDFIGGAGNDRFVNMIPTMNTRAWGQGGNDYLEGYNGVDEFYGGENNDTLVGYGGNDILRGGNGNDVIRGDSGIDYLYGEAGNDHLEGGSEGDVMWGGNNDDRLLGGSGDDQLVGDTGNDQLNGQAGFDKLWGMAGNDVLISIDGGYNEYVEGGADSDILWVDGINNVFQRGFDNTVGVTSADTLHQVGGFNLGADLTLDGDRLTDPSDIGTKLTFTNNITADNVNGSNPLFATVGPGATDISQGDTLGDCWLMATLSSMADRIPQVIRQNVVDFNDGTFGVRLGSGYYRVDNEFGVNSATGGAFDHNLKFAGLGAQNSMWVAVIEKAFAAYTSGAGTYAKLDGGFEETVNKAFRLKDIGSNKISSTYGSATYMANDFYNRMLNGYSQTVSVDADVDGSHVFSVSSFVRNAAGAITGIVLRNPWGTDGLDSFTRVFGGASAGSTSMDGFITVSISQLYNSGGWIDWARA